jgi:hypothetical protein
MDVLPFFERETRFRCSGRTFATDSFQAFQPMERKVQIIIFLEYSFHIVLVSSKNRLRTASGPGGTIRLDHPTA